MKMRRKKRGLYGAGTRHVFAAAAASSEVLEVHHRFQAQHNMDVVHEVSEFHEVSEHEQSTRSVTVTVTWTRRAPASASVSSYDRKWDISCTGLQSVQMVVQIVRVKADRTHSWSELG